MPKSKIENYISDFQNISECIDFSQDISEYSFYFKGKSLKEFLSIGLEFIRQYSLTGKTRKTKQYLHSIYNATCIETESGDLETYEDWLERQLLSIL